MNRCAGVLMNVSSLPSPYGIGVFGKETKEWIDRLSQMRFSVWQVLPFNMLNIEGSPYGSCSAFAGNVLYIDPRGLVEMGLVTEKQAATCEYDGSPYTTDYGFARKTRMALLETAFKAVTPKVQKAIDVFCQKHDWVEAFALYMAVKEKNKETPWWEWDKAEASYEACVKNADLYRERADFWRFAQYLFFKQWEEIHTYAQSKGVRVLGDMPIYVSMDSADVWSHTDLFLLDQRTYRPDKVAGVPPDYFSEDGQLWGNPLYDWDRMKKTGYQWWIDRVKTALELYDSVRIDHFRAFASYWAVPATAKTAKEGKWEIGPRQELFDAIGAAFAEPPSIIAEDLGSFGEDVIALLESSGFPGMRVIQFGFDPGGDSTHLPHNYPMNCVAYVGTHDNNTLLGWLWEASEEERRFALEYCGFDGHDWGEGGYHSRSCRRIIETVWKSAAKLAVISFQDMCGFGSDARMNIPGIAEKNWRFRTTKETIDAMDRDYFAHINRLFRRG